MSEEREEYKTKTNQYTPGEQVRLLVTFENPRKRVEAGTIGTVIAQGGKLVKVSIPPNHWLCWLKEIEKVDDEPPKP